MLGLAGCVWSGRSDLVADLQRAVKLLVRQYFHPAYHEVLAADLQRKPAEFIPSSTADGSTASLSTSTLHTLYSASVNGAADYAARAT
jgi:hypothetical protein